jgi:hypothetical protein
MNYTNAHDVKFVLRPVDNYYHVKYVSQRTGRPRLLGSFKCTSDEMHREMMWILRHTVLCTRCRHQVARQSNMCSECRIARFALQDPQRIESCLVCYGAVFDTNHTRFNLVCGHTICVRCKIALETVSDDLREVFVRCPECRVKTIVA